MHQAQALAPTLTPDGATRTPKGKSRWPTEARRTKGKSLFFGYKANVISDAYYGIPLYINIRPANENEGPVFRQDLDAALQVHPWLKPKYLAGGQGLPCPVQLPAPADLGIVPVIDVPMPQLDKKSQMRLHEGLYNEKGLPVCIGGRSWNSWRPERTGTPVPLPAGGLPPEGQDGLEPVLRLRLRRKAERKNGCG